MDFPFERSFVRPRTFLVTCVRVAPVFVGPDNALIPLVGRAKRGIVTNAFNATLIGPPKRGDTSPPDVFSSRDLITLTFYRVDSFSWSRGRIQCVHLRWGASRDRVLRLFSNDPSNFSNLCISISFTSNLFFNFTSIPSSYFDIAFSEFSSVVKIS